MTLEVDVRPAAAADLAGAHEWYEEQQAGLGRAFLVAVEGAIRRLAAQPLGYPTAAGPVRRALVSKFPYSIYFRVTPTHVRILAVVHQSRHPRTWKARTRS